MNEFDPTLPSFEELCLMRYRPIAGSSMFTVTRDDGLAWYAASAHAERGFCRLCGSVLFWKPVAGPHIAILAGSLDDPSGLKAASHICTEGRPQFYALCDGLPQYLQDSPDIPIAPQGG